MGNPNWPNFPGLANLTEDGDGRPQLLDLIPGKQKGTPLTTQFFNPLLRKICDLQDGVDSQNADGVRSRGDDSDLQVKFIGIDKRTGQIWMKSNDGPFYHAPTDGQYATPDDLSGVVRSPADDADYQVNSQGVNKSSGKLWLYNAASQKFFYPAMGPDLQAEQVRAQTAEANIQNSLANVVRSTADEKNLQVQSIGIEIDNRQIWMKSSDGTFYHAPTDGQYATPDDLSGVVRSPADDADYQVNSQGINKSSGQFWLYNAASQKFFYPAMGTALQAEQVRAQTAEAGIQNSLANVVRSDADATDLQVTFMGVQTSAGALWFGTKDGQFYHPAMESALQAEQIRAQTAEAALQPAGNYVRAVGTAYRKIQTKTVSAVHGDWIYFEEPFNDDDVQVIPFPQDGGNNRIHQANWFEKNRTGWRISLNAWTGSTYANETTPTLVMYVAYGYGG